MGRPGFEESSGAGGPARKEYTRADSDNWRTLREEQEEDEGETGSSWRHSGPRRDGTKHDRIYFNKASNSKTRTKKEKAKPLFKSNLLPLVRMM